MKYTIGLLWIMSVVAAFFVGKSFQSESLFNLDPPSKHAVQSLPKLSSENTAVPVISATDDIDVVKENLQAKADSPGILDLDETLQAIDNLLSKGSAMNMSSLAKAYNLIAGLSQKQVIEALASLDVNSTEPAQTQMMSLFLSRYAEFSPEEAMTFVEQNMSSSKAKLIGSSTVLNIWSETEPLAALDWLKSNNSADESITNNAGLFSVFHGLARQNLDAAIDNLGSFVKDQQALTMAVLGITQSLSTAEDFSRLLSQTHQMDSKKLTKSIVGAWARTGPEDAVEWLNAIEDKGEQKQLEESFYRTWLLMDTDKAADTYMDSSDSSNRQERAKFVAKSLSYRHPEKAFTWLQKQVDIDSESLVKDLVKSSAYGNPEFAAKHLDLFADKKEYLERSVSIYMSYERNSQTQADNFLASSSYKDELEIKISERKERMKKYRKNN